MTDTLAAHRAGEHTDSPTDPTLRLLRIVLGCTLCADEMPNAEPGR